MPSKDHLQNSHCFPTPWNRHSGVLQEMTDTPCGKVPDGTQVSFLPRDHLRKAAFLSPWPDRAAAGAIRHKYIYGYDSGSAFPISVRSSDLRYRILPFSPFWRQQRKAQLKRWQTPRTQQFLQNTKALTHYGRDVSHSARHGLLSWVNS